jgi:hypothetical protein
MQESPSPAEDAEYRVTFLLTYVSVSVTTQSSAIICQLTKPAIPCYGLSVTGRRQMVTGARYERPQPGCGGYRACLFCERLYPDEYAGVCRHSREIEIIRNKSTAR